MEVYLDNSASTKPYEEVAMVVGRSMLECYGNPSSIHSLGEQAKTNLIKCRETIANTLGVRSEEIIFTSGGSESNNFLLKGFVSSKDHIIISKIEHSSILNCAMQLEQDGTEVTYLDVDVRGRIDINNLLGSIKENTLLVSIMHVNNEIGTIQDVEAIGKAIKQYNSNIKFHVDAVQSYGKIALNIESSKIDLMSISSHKIHGPKGIGAAYIKKGLVPAALITGGGQEFGLRSGTENLASIAGFSIAAEKICKNLNYNYKKVSSLKQYFIEGLSKIDGIKINSNFHKNFSPYILNISFVGIRSGKVLFFLDKRGIYVSKGSACSARNLKDSHVLKAVGLKPEEIMGSLRISFSEENTIEEIDYVLENIYECLKELRSAHHE